MGKLAPRARKRILVHVGDAEDFVEDFFQPRFGSFITPPIDVKFDAYFCAGSNGLHSGTDAQSVQAQTTETFFAGLHAPALGLASFCLISRAYNHPMIAKIIERHASA